MQSLKINGFLIVFVNVCALSLSAPIFANERFKSLKEAIFKDPYANRPTYRVTRKLFGKSGNRESNKLRTAARRTLENPADLIEFEHGQKLLQANGICFSGEWRINHDSTYTGLFSAGTRSPIIARASVALSGVSSQNKRAFGLAAKLLPDDLGEEPSLNVFTLNSLGGVVAKHTLDLELTNAPKLGGIPRFADISTALRMRKDLEAADLEELKARGLKERIKPMALFRPVSHLASYKADQVTAPKWLRLRAQTPQRIDLSDFRDELTLLHYNEQNITYFVDVASANAKKIKDARWETIGTIELKESVVSKACDARLHFQHPTLTSN